MMVEFGFTGQTLVKSINVIGWGKRHNSLDKEDHYAVSAETLVQTRTNI